MNAEDKASIKEFKKVVNMTSKRLEDWLETKESKDVGFKESENNESVGHQSGKHIVKLLSKKEEDFTKDDIQHARKVVGYVHRHLAQKPTGNIMETNWRYSLMNWGHDPK